MERRLAKEQAVARVEAAVKAVEVAQKALEAAIAADLEAGNALQEATHEAAKVGQIDRIQMMVYEQEDLARAKKLTEARELKEELRRMGVEMNHSLLTWKGPNGLSGNVKGGRQLKPGDWICETCQVVVFSSKGKLDCFKCGQKKPDVGDDKRGRDEGGRYQSYGRDA